MHERYTWTARNHTYPKRYYRRANKIVGPTIAAHDKHKDYLL